MRLSIILLNVGLLCWTSQGALVPSTPRTSVNEEKKLDNPQVEKSIDSDQSASNGFTENARKVLGSSVVTSVSVILDTGNEKHYADALGRPQAKPQSASQVASPINLLNPDRYEFYTFAESGDLVKRLMTLEEIQGIIANGDGGEVFNYKQPQQQSSEKKVNDVVNNVQNVLKEEIEKTAVQQDLLLQQGGNLNGSHIVLDTPDVSSSWSVILPAIFGNNGQEINSIANANPKPLSQTPETIVLEQPSSVATRKPIATTSKPKKPPVKEENVVPKTTTTGKPPRITSTIAFPTSKYPIKLPSTTRRPLKPTLTKKPYTIRTTPTTAIPRITTRGTRPPPTRRTTLSQKRKTTTSSPYEYENLKNNDPPSPPTLFVIDEKTNTKIPIITREQLNTLLNQLPLESTTELLKSNNFLTPKEPLLESATANIVHSTTANLGQLLLSNNNIFEINSQLGKLSTRRPPLKSTTEQLHRTTPETTSRPSSSITQLINQAVNELSTATRPSNPPTTTNFVTTTVMDTERPVVTTEVIPESTTTLEDSSTSFTEETTPVTSTQSVEELLNEAMGSLLSQVVSSDFTGITTLQELPSTTEFKNDQTEQRVKTTDIQSESTDKIFSETISTVPDQESTTTKNNEETVNTTEPLRFATTILSETDRTEGTEQNTLRVKFETTPSILFEDYVSTIETVNRINDEIPIVWTTSENPTTIDATTFKPEITTETQFDTTTVENLRTTTDFELLTTNTELPTTSSDYTNTQEPSTQNFESTIFERITDTNQQNLQKETTTLSIADLIKELTTKSDAEGDPKTTTIFIITKPPQLTTTLSNKKVTKKEAEPNWSLVSTISPYNTTNKEAEIKEATKEEPLESKVPIVPSKPVELKEPQSEGGLESTTKNLEKDVNDFVQLCNELAFGFWRSVNGGGGLSSARSVFLSPFAATSLLAMVFLGARGATSGEMNEILKLDDMVTFNPHLIFKNVSESLQDKQGENVSISIIVRELYSDRSKGPLLNFYKERAKQFYDGHVEEVSFKEIGDVIRRRTNLIIKKLTGGKIQEYIKDSSITVKSPLAGVSGTIFHTDCSSASVEGRDGELHFVVLPSIRQRRLIPIPAAVWRSGFLAGYEPSLDATAVALGHKDQTLSTIFVIPGQQGIAAPGDGLARLEKRLLGNAFKENSWDRLLQSLIPRPGLEVQIPRFSHKSIINATVALQQMGMKDLFDAEKADLRGLNGVANDLYLSDILQINHFATCGESTIAESHHSEIYPATANRTYYRYSYARKFKVASDSNVHESSELLKEEPRDYQRAFHDPLYDPSLFSLPLPLRPRQARLPDPPRLRFDRPFLYFVRHNPTGLILHMGRFNPRLLP